MIVCGVAQVYRINKPTSLCPVRGCDHPRGGDFCWDTFKYLDFCTGAINVHKQRVSDVCRGREERILIQVIQGPCDAWGVFSLGHDQPFDLKMIGKCATEFRRAAQCMRLCTRRCYDRHRTSLLVFGVLLQKQQRELIASENSYRKCSSARTGTFCFNYAILLRLSSSSCPSS